MKGALALIVGTVIVCGCTDKKAERERVRLLCESAMESAYETARDTRSKYLAEIDEQRNRRRAGSTRRINAEFARAREERERANRQVRDEYEEEIELREELVANGEEQLRIMELALSQRRETSPLESLQIERLNEREVQVEKRIREINQRRKDSLRGSEPDPEPPVITDVSDLPLLTLPLSEVRLWNVSRIIDGQTLEVVPRMCRVNVPLPLRVRLTEFRATEPIGDALMSLEREVRIGGLTPLVDATIEIEFENPVAPLPDESGVYPAYVWVAGHLLNAELILKGKGKHDLSAGTGRYSTLFRQAEWCGKELEKVR